MTTTLVHRFTGNRVTDVIAYETDVTEGEHGTWYTTYVQAQYGEGGPREWEPLYMFHVMVS
jgi:hypothetical protein